MIVIGNYKVGYMHVHACYLQISHKDLSPEILSGQVVQDVAAISRICISDTKFTMELLSMQGIMIYNKVSWLIIRDIPAMTALLEYFDYQFKFTLVDKEWSMYLKYQ